MFLRILQNSQENTCAQVYFSFDLKEGRTHQVEYKPVFVSKEVNTNIFGAKTENKFKSCQWNFQKLFIEYKAGKNQSGFLKCYTEKFSLSTALGR